MNVSNQKIKIQILGLMALLICLAEFTVSANAKGRHFPGFVGTYLFDGIIESGEPGLPPFLTEGLEVQMLVSMGFDGTVVVRHNFGPSNQNLEPALGEWKRTGPRTAKVVYLFFNVPRIQDPVSTTPELGIFIDRVTVHLKMDRRYGIVEGELVNEFFLPDQDPLDPDETPLGAVHVKLQNGRQVIP